MRTDETEPAVDVLNPAPVEEITCIKGFDANLQCRGFQFAIGQSYTHEGAVKLCESGFHAIEGHPLDVFDYYAPAGSRFTEVSLSGKIARKVGGDSKIASASITIKAELHLHELIARAVEWVFDNAKLEKGSSATGDRGAASATGYRGAASATGYQGAASATGDQGAASATGYRGAASATGDQGAASATGGYCAASATGTQGAASATGGYGAASATGTHGAASATGTHGAASATGDQGAASATGDQGAASATGYQGAASATGTHGAASATGYQGAASATGKSSVALASGYHGKASAAEGCALFLVNRDEDTGDIKHAWAGIAGRDGIKPNQYYSLNDDGHPYEV